MPFTYRKLLEKLNQLSEEQLDQRVQVVDPGFDDSLVCVCHPGISLNTIENFDLRYVRSANDNKKHPEDVVILIDENPFAANGIFAYELKEDGSEVPQFKKDWDQSADWTGPAQLIADDEEMEQKGQKDGQKQE